MAIMEAVTISPMVIITPLVDTITWDITILLMVIQDTMCTLITLRIHIPSRT